jgi:hypothetical protein
MKKHMAGHYKDHRLDVKSHKFNIAMWHLQIRIFRNNIKNSIKRWCKHEKLPCEASRAGNEAPFDIRYPGRQKIIA